jgi:hypothetical protein
MVARERCITATSNKRFKEALNRCVHSQRQAQIPVEGDSCRYPDTCTLIQGS